MAIPKTVIFTIAEIIVLLVIIYKIMQFWNEEITAIDAMELLPTLFIIYFIMTGITMMLMKMSKK